MRVQFLYCPGKMKVNKLKFRICNNMGCRHKSLNFDQDTSEKDIFGEGKLILRRKVETNKKAFL